MVLFCGNIAPPLMFLQDNSRCAGKNAQANENQNEFRQS